MDIPFLKEIVERLELDSSPPSSTPLIYTIINMSNYVAPAKTPKKGAKTPSTASKMVTKNK